MKSAYSEYLCCLKVFGLSLPSTRLESISLILWQFIRLFLHHIWIGRILSRRAGDLFCNGVQRKDALVTARELAIIFNRLNQLHLTLNIEKNNTIHGLIFAIYSVNMAEVADGLLTPNELYSIYIMTALRIKYNYSMYLKCIVRYFLNRAKSEYIKVPIKPSKCYHWTFTTYGYDYILANNFTYNHVGDNNNLETTKSSLFAQLKNPSDPISHVIKVILHIYIYINNNNNKKTYNILN